MTVLLAIKVKLGAALRTVYCFISYRFEVGGEVFKDRLREVFRLLNFIKDFADFNGLMG